MIIMKEVENYLLVIKNAGKSVVALHEHGNSPELETNPETKLHEIKQLYIHSGILP